MTIIHQACPRRTAILVLFLSITACAWANPVARFSVTPNPGAYGQVLSFDASASYDTTLGRQIVYYIWDFNNDGIADAQGRQTTHAYQQFGTFTARLVVVNNSVPPQTNTSTARITIDQGNHSPTASPGGPYVLETGRSLVLDGTASSDADIPCGDSIVNYGWDLNGDGADDYTGATRTVAFSELLALGLAYPANPVTGEPKNTVRLRVTDTFGAQSSALVPLRIYSNQPVAVFTASPNPSACHQVVSFNASGSYHGFPGRSIVQYLWNFGDGTAASGQTNSHAYQRFGAFQVELKVVDDNIPARTNTAYVTVNVNQGNHPPVAAAGGPYVIGTGGVLYLDGSGSFEPDAACGDTITSYAWDLNNDGTADASGATPMLTPALWTSLGLAYPANPVTGLPTNVVTLRVTDSLGVTTSATSTLTVYDNRPVAVFSATPNPVNCGEAITLDASQSYHGYPIHQITSYFWEFVGEGTATTGRVTNHVFHVAGTHRVRLTVTDDCGVTSSTEKDIVVTFTNHPPVARSGGPYAIEEGQALVLDGAQSWEPDTGCGDTIAAASWDVNADGVPDATGLQCTIPWSTLKALPGIACPAHPAKGIPSNVVNLVATDAQGLASTNSTVLRIYHNSPVPLFTNTPLQAGGCFEPVTFDGSLSYHGAPGHAVTQYLWDFGDGTSATKSVVTHTFPAMGTYRVVLTLTDDNVPPRSSSKTNLFTVEARNGPTAAPGGPYTISIGEDFAPDGSASSDPDIACGDSIVSYAWSINSGTFALGVRPTVSYAYLTNHCQVVIADPVTTYPANWLYLRVTDTTGRWNERLTPLRVYDNRPFPAFTLSSQIAATNQAVLCDAGPSHHGHPGHHITAYEWDFDQGQQRATGAVVTVRFASAGAHAGLLVVRDDNAPPRTNSCAIAVRVIQPPRLEARAIAPDGSFRGRVSAEDGIAYRLETSTNLASWTALLPFFTTNGLFEFLDPSQPAVPQRFYRVTAASQP